MVAGLSGMELFLLLQSTVGSSLASPGLSRSAAGTKFIAKGHCGSGSNACQNLTITAVANSSNGIVGTGKALAGAGFVATGCL